MALLTEPMAGSAAAKKERLQKVLARAGVASRRRAEELIRCGRISVNGRVVTGMGYRVDPAQDRIAFDGRPVQLEKKVYILLNKPAGYVTTLADPQGRPIVTDLVRDVGQRIFPVGRLDLDSEGALLLTNDGALANHILHPRYEVNKTYEVELKKTPSRQDLRHLEEGILLDGRKTWPARLRILSRAPGRTIVEIIIHEGKKRQVRKMFQTKGFPVIRLKRTAYGDLKIGALPSGKYRFLGKNDLKKIFSGKIPFTIKNIPD